MMWIIVGVAVMVGIFMLGGIFGMTGGPGLHGDELTSHYGDIYKQIRLDKIAALEQEKSLSKMLDIHQKPAKIGISQIETKAYEGRKFKEVE